MPLLLRYNMAYYLKCKEVGSKLVSLPLKEPWEMTNFIKKGSMEMFILILLRSQQERTS